MAASVPYSSLVTVWWIFLSQCAAQRPCSRVWRLSPPRRGAPAQPRPSCTAWQRRRLARALGGSCRRALRVLATSNPQCTWVRPSRALIPPQDRNRSDPGEPSSSRSRRGDGSDDGGDGGDGGDGDGGDSGDGRRVLRARPGTCRRGAAAAAAAQQQQHSSSTPAAAAARRAAAHVLACGRAARSSCSCYVCLCHMRPTRACVCVRSCLSHVSQRVCVGVPCVYWLT